MKIRNLLSVLFVLLATECPSVALGGTEAQYAALQNFCAETNLWRKSGEQGPLPSSRAMGLGDLIFFNHYCDAVGKLDNLYAARNETQIRNSMASIVRGVQYTIDNNPNHYLLPEVQSTLGKAFYVTHDYVRAEVNLLKALSLDPRHAPVYVTLAEVYRDTKRLDKAKEAVRAGLALNPDLKGLQRLGRELGIAVEPAKPAAEKVKAKEATTITPPAREGVVPVQSKAAGTQAKVGEDAATPSENPVDIGQPGDPWCRFCPDTPAAPPASTPAMPGVVPTAAH